MIQTWHITRTHNIKLDLQASTLDEVTRQLPDGYYSTFRTFDGCLRVLGLTSHLRRLYGPVSSAEVDEAVLRRQLRTLLESYRPGEARVRAVMTREGQAYLAMAPLSLPRAIYENGVRAETTPLQREHPRLKSTSFIDRSDAERKHIAEEGIFEALLVKEGQILEGMTSNFFYILRAERSEERSLLRAQSKREITLCTARNHILLGITREMVIDLAQAGGLEVKYRPLKLDQLPEIEEAFLTSSSRGIVPIVQIDHLPVGQGSPGPITQQLSAAYEQAIIQRAEEI